MSWKIAHERSKLKSSVKKDPRNQSTQNSRMTNTSSHSKSYNIGEYPPRQTSLPNLNLQMNKSLLSPSNAEFQLLVDQYPLETQIKVALKPIINPKKRLECLKERVSQQITMKQSSSGVLPMISRNRVAENPYNHRQDANKSDIQEVSTHNTSMRFSTPASKMFRSPSILQEEEDEEASQENTGRMSVEPKTKVIDSGNELTRRETVAKIAGEEYLSHDEILKILKQINSSELLSFEDFKPTRRISTIIQGTKPRDNKMIDHSKGIGDKLRRVDMKLLDAVDNTDSGMPGKNDEASMQAIYNEFKDFTSLHKENEKELKERQLRLESMKQRSKELNWLLNDFRPKKKPETENKKEYYNKWYVPVQYWNVEKLKEANMHEVEHLKTDDAFIYKNLHNYGRNADANPLKQANHKGPHQLRYELIQEKMRQSVVAARFKQETVGQNLRAPDFLHDVPIQNSTNDPNFVEKEFRDSNKFRYSNKHFDSSAYNKR